MFYISSRDGEKVEDAFTVDLGLVEDTAADGRLSSLKTTSVHTSEPEDKVPGELPEDVMAVDITHGAETDRL